ncbi:hypothetical protein D9615_003763 [Tricholomella constricta]|uniref:Peptidase M20 dimerisation domain-containing protein n=1 Tax=Tricholomella constricta TaxID=117010 RepID=A0A8H5HHP8_9AGAR|nr:hypothetical protein D9615_003763 [Tricholomella constricta]
MEFNDQPGCFSTLGKLLHRRRSSRTDWKSVGGGNTVVYHEPAGVRNVVEGVVKHNHISCGAGAEWILDPEGPPSYTSPDYLVSDAKYPLLDADIVKTIETTLDRLDTPLRDLSLKIHSYPELAFEEKYAHKIMTDFMEEHGFKVTRHYAGLRTAWHAEFTVGKGGRVLGVNSEMDALPGIGHACGHNLIAICGLGIAIAVKTALVAHSVAGKVIILGTPAEEGGGGKIVLLKKDAYREMDVCLMAHPAAGALNSSSNGITGAAQSMFIEFTGRTAHAAAAPWEGKNALDAAVVAYSAISALRQQIKPDHRIHGVVEGSNWTANTIPDNARLTYIVRAPNKAELTELAERVVGCFQGAAASSGCKVKVELAPAYLDLRQNSALAREFSINAISRYNMTINEIGSAASTDFVSMSLHFSQVHPFNIILLFTQGNVSYEIPSLHPLYAIPTSPNGGNHTAAFTRSAHTREAHAATMNVTRGLALTGFRVLFDTSFFKEVKGAFELDKTVRGAT